MICKVLEPGLSAHDLQACYASISHGSDSLRAFISTTATATIQALLQVGVVKIGSAHYVTNSLLACLHIICSC